MEVTDFEEFDADDDLLQDDNQMKQADEAMGKTYEKPSED